LASETCNLAKRKEVSNTVELSVFHSYGEELEKRLRLRAFPLAIKLLEKEADIPEEAIRPKRDLGYHLLPCQGFALSRREGTTIAMLKEDMWCFEPVIGYGLAEPPECFLEGRTRYPRSAKTLEAGRDWAAAFPRLKPGKYIGIVSAPLNTANFEPDLVVIYCNSVQSAQLISAAVYIDGRDISYRTCAAGACVYAVVPVMESGECTIAIPCGGDRNFAMAQDDEIIFSFPKEKLEDLLAALREHEKVGHGLPQHFMMMREPEMPEDFVSCARILGMDM
jgi:uncharacterized protein (DUF169 family)